MIITPDAPPAVLHGELSGDGKTIVLIGVGPDPAIAQMAARIQLMTPLIKPSNPPGALLVPATWAAVVQLSYLFGAAWKAGPRLTEWLMAETVLRTPDGGGLSVELPEGLVPRPYQIGGARMIGALGRALLFDEAGTGKTITTILGLLERDAQGHLVTPVVVVAPASVVDPWIEAFQTWAPQWRVNAWRGSPEQRRRLAARPEGTQAHVLVSSYDTAARDSAKGGPLARVAPKSVVVDECHLIKTAHSARSMAARRLAKRALNFVALSGTPITHHPGDLWPTLEALAPLAWPSGERWKARYCVTIPGDYSAKVIGLNEYTEAEMRTTLHGQHRRVAKADVLQQLPPKVYSVRQVDLPPAYRKAYDQMEQDMIAELPGGEELSVMSVLAQLTRLQQLASAAADVTVTTEVVEEDGLQIERPHVQVQLKAPSWKVDALLEVLAERPGEPVVAFAPSRQLMALAGEQATKAGLQVGYVMGGQSMKERTATVEAFQRGKLDLLCVTTGAGGVGLTLTAARTVVFLQRPWSLVEAAQAEDRCFGAGTPVLTPNGWIPIENVQIGDRVITHTGAAQAVTDAWSQQSKKLMAEVSITGQQAVTCTADHRFLTREGAWKAAQDLRPGDWLAMPGNDAEGVDELTELSFGPAQISQTFDGAWGPQRNGRLKQAPDTVQVTDDFLYTIGYFAGDGFASILPGKGRFVSFSGNNTTKTAALDRCQAWAESAGLNGSRRASARSNSVEQRFYSAEWAHWFHREFGGRTGAVHKRLPDFALRLNQRQSRLVLQGLADSDGYRRSDKPRCEFVTMSQVLAANVVQLATRAGYWPSTTRGSTGQLIVAFGGTPGPRSAGRVRSVLLRHPAKPGGERERVYDLTVAEDSTFVVGGVVVHNCHRIGSEIHESIEVIDVVATKTIDTRIRAVLHEKAGQLADLLQDRRIVTQLLGGSTLRKAS
jgi:hypothetical protein